MRIYEIPICIRYTPCGVLVKHSVKTFCSKINGIGMFVCFSKRGNKNIVAIDAEKIFIKKTKAIIIANDCELAIKAIYECEGAQTGGDTPYSKAMWIDEKRPIIEFPHCAMLHRNEHGKFVCGMPKSCGTGEFGECFLETHNPPQDCTIASFCEYLSENYNKCCKFADEILGYKIIRAQQVPIELPGIQFISEECIPIEDLPEVEI